MSALPATSSPPTAQADAQRLAELVEIVRAYNDVTARLEESHIQLNAEVARLQKELASANAALQRSRRLAALGEMAAGIAHEVRNPLASIQLYAQMLSEDLADRPEQQETADKIASAVRGLDGIVNDVLSFARELRVRRAPVDVRSLLERAASALRPSMDEVGVELSIDCDEQLETRVDVALLHQCLVNIARNAIEAMRDGGQLSLSATSCEQGVVIVVRDTGPGISDEATDRIFNPFFTTRHTGTGLGLAIVHRIVDAHGGSIAVHNDGGAVFTISLPEVDDPPAWDEPEVTATATSACGVCTDE